MVTVSLELSGAEASRPYVQQAGSEHPSLLDPEHLMDTLFGVVNIPSVVWIDEQGVIVRPPEPGWPGVRRPLPEQIALTATRLRRAPTAPQAPPGGLDLPTILNSGQQRADYADALRDWVRLGPASRYVLTPDEVVGRAQPWGPEASEAAAHFALANHLWRHGQVDRALVHFNACARLEPGNWTYKRQAWSLVGNSRVGGTYGRFAQAPLAGEEAEWPFESDFGSDAAQLGAGEYYPRTL